MKINEQVLQCFDHDNYAFHSITYQKDEMIVSPLIPNNKIIFILSGSIAIYALLENGEKKPVGYSDTFTMLGDIEFVNNENPTFYVEARSKVKAVYLDRLHENQKLHQDITFLHYVLDSIALKLKMSSTHIILPLTIEERVMEYLDENPSIQNIEKVAFQLHCSKRQLIRVLHKLCEENILIHPKKGLYTKKEGN